MWTKGEGPSPSVDADESIEDPPPLPPPPSLSSSSAVEIVDKSDNRPELVDYREIMLKTQFDLKKKEEEVQEYAEKLTKIKSKVKSSRRSTDSSTSNPDPTKKKKDDDKTLDYEQDENVSDEKAKTPKAKSHLLRKKLAENRRVFQQRNKEIHENERAVKEKVEEIRQQINDTDLSIEKDKKFIELTDKINELQATIIDLQDNLKEKDSVIDSKTRAITLMSEDLSKKSKTTLDTLEETKTEMRLMQENFIQLESSYKTKIDHLMNQLREKGENLELIQHEHESINLINVENEKKLIEMEEKTRDLMDLIEKKNLESNFNEEYEKNMDKLKLELEEANKNMIKMKAQHKNKLKNLQRRLENSRTMSNTNADTVGLENQVALLEEEKGNLQLSLVDFDELKVSNEELQRRINDLENSTVTQSNEIQMQIEAIAVLENQKLDLIQELHGLKQEMSALENENAESENSRVTAELKIVELEEQLEKLNRKKFIDPDNSIIIENLTESEKNETDKKSTDSGSTESFERIMDPEPPITDESLKLNEKISYLTLENNDLIIKLTKIQEKMSESENYREKLNELLIENEKLINNNHDNLINKQNLLSLETEIINLKKTLDEKHEENEKLINNLAINHENSQVIQVKLNEKISLLELQSVDNYKTIESLEKIIHELELKKSENDDEINELNENKNKLNELIDEKVEFYINSERELREKITKLENQIEYYEEMNKNLNEREKLIENYSTEKNNYEKLIKNISGENEKLSLINSELTREIDDLKLNKIKEIENYEVEKNKIILENNQLKLELNEINKKHLDNIKKKDEKFNKMYKKLTEENNILEHQNTSWEMKMDYSLLGYNQQGDTIKKMRKENEENLNKNSKLINEIEDLKIKIENLNSENLEKNNLTEKYLEEKLNLEIKLRESEENERKLSEKLEEEIKKYNELSNQMENQLKYSQEIKEELSNNYSAMENLKTQHEENILILNQQLSSLTFDLNNKLKENDELKLIINEREKIIDNNFTREMKISLEEKISWLERDLEEANNNTQAQLHKMKIIAANLKKKTVACQEFEGKFAELEEKLRIDKEEKEKMNEEIYLLNKIKEESEEKLNEVTTSLKNAEQEIENGKIIHEKLLKEFNNYREENSMELNKKERELIEVKENARELGVRMQVMEGEYLEQLNIINKSETEHRLLLAKLSQVNESLETTKNESTELKNYLENLKGQIEEDKRERARELNGKIVEINNLMTERDQLLLKIEEYGGKIEEINILTTQRDELSLKLGEYQGKIEEINNLTIERDQLLLKLEEYREKIEEINNLTIERNELSSKLEKYQEKIEEINNLTTERDQLLLKLEEYREKIEEINNLTIERDDLSLKLEEYQEKINEINNLSIERDELLLKLKEYQEKIESMNNLMIERDELSLKLEKYQEKIEEMNNLTVERDELSLKLEEYQEKITEINNLTIERNELSLKLNEYQEKITEINNLTIERNELSLKLEDYKQKYEDLIKKYETIKQEHESQIINLDTKSTPVAEKLTDEILFDASKCFGAAPEDNNRISELKKSLAEEKAEKTIIENKYHELTIEINELKLQIVNLIAENEKNRQKIDEENSSIAEAIKLDDDEWGWNAKEAEIESNSNNLQPVSSVEVQLNAKIAELHDTIKDITDEKLNLTNELKLIQIKNTKLIRKLKEYKLQSESLSQQLKIQLTSGGLSDLDSAIEEELKSQVSQLEKNLLEIKNENEKIIFERDNLLKKIDVLIGANERFTDMKERQDRDLEVMSIRNEELIKKIQLLEENDGKINKLITTSDDAQCNKCEEKISELQESMELLAVENEELRQLIELEKNKFVKKNPEEKCRTGELKINFYDMLEKSHYVEKKCLGTLEETKQEKIEASEKIHELEESIREKEMIIKNCEEKIENYRESLTEKMGELEVTNKKIVEIENNLSSEIKLKQMDIDMLNKTIESLRMDSDGLIKDLTSAKEETERVKKILNEEIKEKELKIQNLEETLELNYIKMNAQVEELTELEHQMENMKIHLEINSKICRELEEKCLENLENENNSENIKNTRDLFVSEAKNRDENIERELYINEIEENLKTALQDREKSRENYEKLEEKFTEIQDNLANVTELLNVRVQEVAELKKYIQKLEFDKLALENCQTNVDELNKKLINKENDLTTINKNHNRELQEKQLEILNLHEKIAELNSEFLENNLHRENQASEIKSIKELINNSEILITKLNEEILLKTDKILDLENKIGSYTEEIQRLIGIIGELESESSKKNDEHKKLENKITELIEINKNVNEDYKLIEKQLKSELSVKEEEIEDLKYILNESTYPTIIQQLQDKIDKLYEEKLQLEKSLPINNLSVRQLSSEIIDKTNEINNENTNKLDIALYTLHQRDVRCDELTHELMQLLEERDTLQLRLSNAIRVNEKLRKLSMPSELSSVEQHDVDDGVGSANQNTVSDAETQMSVDISQSDTDDERKMLAQKLSQLHNVGHRKDIRLLDERELRNTQQMSLIAHKDALSTLPPDAAARLINANYTLSQDEQSQPSVLLNWLWGKSTPKVVHM